MIRIVEQCSQAKSTTTPSEDAVVVTASYAAVIDGATPKTAFRYPDGETPGMHAARILARAIADLPVGATADEAAVILTKALQVPNARLADRPAASCLIYNDRRREVWMFGDCQFATITANRPLQSFANPKRIDHLLADWRRAVNISLLSRGIMTAEDIAADDPGRRIIQPQITAQVRFQNLHTPHPLAFCVLDGQPVPHHLIRVVSIPQEVTELILASDGYPELHPTLAATEAHLQQLLAADPLCIGPLLGTKGLRPGCQSYDDRTYLRIQI